MNVLITGSNGYIGSNIAIFLKKKNIIVYGIGSKSIHNYNYKKKIFTRKILLIISQLKI